VIPKSRYDTVSTYISQDSALRPEYNDLDLVIDENIKKRLVDNGSGRPSLLPGRWGDLNAQKQLTLYHAHPYTGMDERLATHFAHLFIRDPLVIFQETLNESPDDKSDHFEV
jgi:glutamate--cysteine ligase catalytic subunit